MLFRINITLCLCSVDLCTVWVDLGTFGHERCKPRSTCIKKSEKLSWLSSRFRYHPIFIREMLIWERFKSWHVPVWLATFNMFYKQRMKQFWIWSKVRKFQNKNMKSLNCQKYERKNLKNSVLNHRAVFFKFLRLFWAM